MAYIGKQPKKLGAGISVTEDNIEFYNTVAEAEAEAEAEAHMAAMTAEEA